MIAETRENLWIDQLTRLFGRSPLQLNALHESDAEVLDVRAPADACLVATVDTVSEEIRAGLYDDPHLIGWMTVTACLSDLAAVGADPIGVLLSEVLPEDHADSWTDRLQRGIEKACAASRTFVLGGDTSVGPTVILTGCALGWVERSKRLSRIGCRPDDLVYTTGSMGTGNAFALQRLLGVPGSRVPYRPMARLSEAKTLAPLATSCMDTSDGVLATLDQLSRLNHVGFVLEREWRAALRPDVEAAARAAGLPAWIVLAGQHGDYELIATVPPEREATLLELAAACGWSPLRIGRVTSEPGVRLWFEGRHLALDTGRVRDLAFQGALSPRAYVEELLRVAGGKP